MAEKDKDKFSFESAPEKIGGGAETADKNSEFSFDDVPVLGKKEKSGSIVDILGGAVPQPQKKRRKNEEKGEEAPFNVKDSASGSPADKSATGSDDIFSSDLDSWLEATPKKKKINKKLIITLSVVGLFVFSMLSVFFVVIQMKSKSQEDVQASQLARKISKEEQARIKAEQEKKRFEAEIAEAEKMISENELASAEEKLKELQSKHPEKSVVYNSLAMLYLKKQNFDSAVENFIKAISTGSEIPNPFAQLCKIYISQGKYTEAADFADKGLKKFPEDQDLLKISAKIALKTGDKDKAAELYGKTSKSELSQSELQDYASLLITKREKKKAREIYVYAGKKFSDAKSFEKAVAIESDPIEKNSIINTAISVFEKDQELVSRMLMLLVKELLKSGRKDMAIEKAKAIDTSALNDDDCVLFLQLSLESSSDIIIRDQVETIISKRKDCLELLKKIHLLLSNAGKNNLSAEIFSEFWAKNPDNPLFEYFYAKSLDPLPEAIPYYKDALSKKPKLLDALFDLGNCLIAHRKYNEAREYLMRAEKIHPDNPQIQKSLFFSRFYNERKREHIDNYRKFLESVQSSDIPIQLIEFAQQLNDPSYSKSLIAEMKEKNSKSAKYWEIRHDLVYWDKPEKHFSDYYPPDTRDLYVLFLLANAKFKQVILLPTPPEKFPEFWKIFILWRSNAEKWEELVEIFREKNKNNPYYELISAVMLGKIDAEEARKQIYRIPHELEPIFFLVLAEKFKSEGAKIKAKVCYSKGAGDYPHPYKKIIELLEKY